MLKEWTPWTDLRDGQEWEVRVHHPAGGSMEAKEHRICFREMNTNTSGDCTASPSGQEPGEFGDEELQDLLDAARRGS